MLKKIILVSSFSCILFAAPINNNKTFNNCLQPQSQTEFVNKAELRMYEELEKNYVYCIKGLIQEKEALIKKENENLEELINIWNEFINSSK